MDSFAGISFPIGLVLIPFGLFAAVYVFYSAFNLFHLLRFGVSGPVLNLIATVYAFGSIVLLLTTIVSLSRYDFSVSVSLADLATFSRPPEL